MGVWTDDDWARLAEQAPRLVTLLDEYAPSQPKTPSERWAATRRDCNTKKHARPVEVFLLEHIGQAA